MFFQRSTISQAAAALLAAFWCAAFIAQAAADPPSGANEQLVFADNFNGTSLDTTKWLNSSSSDAWAMPASAATASSSKVAVANGMLTISATRTSSTAFTSGDITTYQKENFSGGYIEARIQLPSTVGSWPAFWGLYTGWPPEADIMEYPDTSNGDSTGLLNSQYNTNYHYLNSSGADAAGAGAVNPGAGDLEGTWHTFGMQWVSNTSVAFYFDGKQVSSFNNSALSQMPNMYMLLDYAVGGWPGTPSTSQWAIGHTDQMNVDWVRVWQTNSNNATATSWNVNGNGNFGTSGSWTAGVPSFGNEVATFGRVGTVPSAFITMNNSWQLFGGITFDGLTTGTNMGTTAYTLGATTGGQIQLASTSSSGVAVVQATAASTANQIINAPMDLNNNTTFSNFMTGGQLLSLNGTIAGPGSLAVGGSQPINGVYPNAPGTVVISGSNTYSGGTVIGNGQEGAVLEANSNLALSTGNVLIGTGGNATTAKFEVAGSHTLANNISFNGRNNNSVGIESVSGNNVLSGTISANVGGGTYQIQSDAGTFTLSGAATGATTAGVALQALATGSRTFTLQGAGNGVVSGNIANGSGTVSIVAGGTGTWTFSHADSYTGTTTVSGGSLVLSVPNAIANTSQVVLNGGTLATSGLGQTFASSTTLAVGSAAGSVLDLGATASTVAFGNSHTAGWSGTLTINNWTFGTNHLLIGGNSSGLTSSQLSDIKFADFSQGASISNVTNANVTAGEVTPLIGDISQDSHVDMSDVIALEQALADSSDYAAAHPNLSSQDINFLLDVNGDGQDNNADIQALIISLTAGNGSNAAVPEPASLVLLSLGALLFAGRRRTS